MFSSREAHSNQPKWTLTVFIPSLVLALFIKGLFYKVVRMKLIKDQNSLRLRVYFLPELSSKGWQMI
jgi:hypothetical protein